MGQVHHLERPEKLTSYICISDLHLSHLDIKSFSLFCAFAKMIPMPQRKIIILGDTLALDGFLKKNNDAFKLHHGRGNWDWFVAELERETILFDQIYPILRELVLDPEDIMMVLGNHEARLYSDYFIKKVSEQYKRNFDYNYYFRASERKLRIIPYNDCYHLPVGEGLRFSHGEYAGGVNPLRTNFLSQPVPEVVGHIHREFSYPAKTRDEDVVRQYYSVPCLCTKEADAWMGGKSHGHSQGFAVVTADPDTYNLAIMRIKDHKLFLPTGEVFKA